MSSGQFAESVDWAVDLTSFRFEKAKIVLFVIVWLKVQCLLPVPNPLEFLFVFDDLVANNVPVCRRSMFYLIFCHQPPPHSQIERLWGLPTRLESLPNVPCAISNDVLFLQQQSCYSVAVSKNDHCYRDHHWPPKCNPNIHRDHTRIGKWMM